MRVKSSVSPNGRTDYWFEGRLGVPLGPKPDSRQTAQVRSSVGFLDSSAYRDSSWTPRMTEN